MYPEKYFLISDYQSMELLGVKGLFTNFRVDRESLPEGFFKYSLREGDDGYASSVEENVLVNHMGDFICKQELNLNGHDEYDIYDEYGFTDEEVDLDEFFGVNIKLKIAQELDEFAWDFDTYNYKDNMTSDSREDVVREIRTGLDDKSYTAGLIEHFQKILVDYKDADFFDDELKQKVLSFVCVLTEINENNCDSLDKIVDNANKVKEQQVAGTQEKAPEIQQ